MKTFSTKLALAFAVSVILAGFASLAHAQTIYNDPLTEYPSGTELNGQLVPTGTGAGTAWNANDTTPGYQGNGYYEDTGFPIDENGPVGTSPIGVRDDGGAGDTAYLPFTPVGGKIYTLSATFLGFNYLFGFTTVASTSTYPSLINTNPGLSVWDAGGRFRTLVNETITEQGSQNNNFYPQNEVTITLNTTAPAWTVDFSDTDTYYGLNTFTTGPLTLSSNPTSLSSVAISQSGGAAFQITNFDLTESTPVPEPTTWAMMGVGLIALVVFQRRRAKNGVSA